MFDKNNKKLLLIGGGILGMFILALAVWSLSGDRSVQTADGEKRNAMSADVEKGWQDWPTDAPPSATAPFNSVQARKHQREWADYLNLPVERTNSIGMKFVLIPPGEFKMGSTPGEIEAALKVAGDDRHWQDCIRSEAPQHKVILAQPIYLGVHEVTQKEYETVMKAAPSYFASTGPGKDLVANLDTTNFPVEMVNWNDAAEFCAKLSQIEDLKPFYLCAGATVIPLEGTGYRLPAEAEWEFACRAGTTTKFCTGDADEDVSRAGWIVTNSGRRTHAAGQLKANALGLFDMHGNVWEWVADWWEPGFYGQFLNNSAVNPEVSSSTSSLRALRGGYSHGVACYSRSSGRRAHDPLDRVPGIGFRVALVAAGSRKPASLSATPSDAETLLAFETPGFDQWVQEVAVLPAEKQVEAVARKLQELNPGFDGKVTHKVDYGVATELRIVCDNVTDISPVRALAGLKKLSCYSDPATGKLADLSPLQGMSLTTLACHGTQVSDLSPLREVPLLTTLYCGKTLVSDLSPLKGMSLNVLTCNVTEVSDLSPLQGMKLNALVCTNTLVADLSPLKGMPLWQLHCSATKVTDLSPLKDMPLTDLQCDFKPDRDTEILRSIKTLETINGKPAAEFWKEVEGQQKGKKP